MPGVEVLANEVYTLLHGSLAAVPRAVTAGLVLLTTLLWPTVARRRHGLSLTLLSSGAVIGLAALFFLAGLYLPPAPLIVALVAAYLLGNYQRLRALDADLLLRLTRLFDAANFSQAPAVSGATPAVPGQALRGFGPRGGNHDDARAMIRSLISALDGRGRLLLLQQQRIEVGEVTPALEQLARRVQNGVRQLSEGRFPHHLAQALDLPGGVLAVSLPSPPPPHLVALIEESARVFSQSARYRDLRQRTTTLAETLWPFRARSSEAKIEAIAMITDLLQTERSWLGVLLEHLPQALFISGPYGYRIYQNPAARRLLGEERDLLHAIPRHSNWTPTSSGATSSVRSSSTGLSRSPPPRCAASGR
jgi:PAS domain-containing protein